MISELSTAENGRYLSLCFVFCHFILINWLLECSSHAKAFVKVSGKVHCDVR